MSAGGDLGNPLRKFKLVFLGEQSGESVLWAGLGYPPLNAKHAYMLKAMYVILVDFLKVSAGSEGCAGWLWLIDACIGSICGCRKLN